MRRAKNVSAKSAIKTASRKVLDAVAAGNAEEAKALLVIACKKIDQAAANRLFHKNCAHPRLSFEDLVLAEIKLSHRLPDQ